jgi:tetratricopeptide (TPR) repeat protein
LRFAYGDDSITPETLRKLESFCREAWSARGLLLQATETRLEADEEELLRTDLFDVAVLRADFHKRLARPDEAEVARLEAAAILAEAEAFFGPGAVLAREQRVLRGGVAGADPEPRTAWEHYAVGRWLVRAGHLDKAAVELDKAVAQRPHDFWPWFWRGLCAYRLHHYDEAVTDFTACIVLASDSAVCYFNRGLAQAARGSAQPAREDYCKSLELDPGLAAAALNRGVLSLHEKRYDDAIADFERALTSGAEPASVHFNLALAHQAKRDRAAAVASLEQALRIRPDLREARDLRDRLLSAR